MCFAAFSTKRDGTVEVRQYVNHHPFRTMLLIGGQRLAPECRGAGWHPPEQGTMLRRFYVYKEKLVGKADICFGVSDDNRLTQGQEGGVTFYAGNVHAEMLPFDMVGSKVFALRRASIEPTEPFQAEGGKLGSDGSTPTEEKGPDRPIQRERLTLLLQRYLRSPVPARNAASGSSGRTSRPFSGSPGTTCP